MAKQSPFYKTGISRSPLNNHHVYGLKDRLAQKKRIEEKNTK